MAIVNHSSAAGSAVISNNTLVKVVPIFVAVMVWLIRVLIIGTFSVAGDNLFSTGDRRAYQNRGSFQQSSRPLSSQSPSLRSASSLPRPASQTFRPAPKPASQTTYNNPEPTYHNVSFDASASDASERLMN